jgi:hypothetical protein
MGKDWLEQAFAYTAVDCKGARGPLTRIRPRPIRSRTARTCARHTNKQAASSPGRPAYRVADYLDQHSRHLREGPVSPGKASKPPPPVTLLPAIRSGWGLFVTCGKAP